MTWKRKRSRRDTQAAQPGVHEPEVHCYKLSLAIARSMVSSGLAPATQGGQPYPSKKLPPALSSPCASISAGESASRRGGPRRHT